jgi:hypothetical protein
VWAKDYIHFRKPGKNFGLLAGRKMSKETQRVPDFPGSAAKLYKCKAGAVPTTGARQDLVVA